jgi:hypothetical protein
MKSAHCLLLTLTILAFYAAPTYAGITLWNPTNDAADSVIVTNDVFAPSNDGYTWHVSETFLGSGPGVGTLDVTGLADTDPRITVTKNVDDTTGLPWYGYQVDITGTAGYAGDATTDQGTWLLTREYWLADACGFEFGGSTPVLPGQTLTLSFSLVLPPGGFSFEILQTPVYESVPAPGALVLAGIGATAVGYLRRRTAL